MTINQSYFLVNDVTHLNPIVVQKILSPKTINDVVEAILNAEETISVGGGKFSMGGQTALERSLHLDMRQLNQILDFDQSRKKIAVQAGCTWRQIQEYIDPFNLSVKIMQTYANFTVGGSLSVNCHGRYMGFGPLVLSVDAIKIVLADGSIKEATPKKNSEIFYAAIGGYGGIGVIVEATLQLADNIKVSRHNIVLSVKDYLSFFKENIRSSKHAIFHNADLYPPNYKKIRAVTWFESYEPVTISDRLIPKQQPYHLQKYFLWVVSENKTGKWRRQWYVDPLFYRIKKVVWRNYEASYDVAELEPRVRTHSTYVLQEYFVPISQFEIFSIKIAEILKRFNVNVLNISVRHAYADPGTLLAWAKEEVFAFVLYYKERVSLIDRNRVPIWTRALIDAALSCGGRYYLPYQIHATKSQFQQAYPGYVDFFKLKETLDPNNKFSNKFLEKYGNSEDAMQTNQPASEFKQVFMQDKSRDDFYLFLQNVFNVMPEDAFHLLIYQLTQKYENDQTIYEALQKEVDSIKVLLNDVRYALPALIKQKKEMASETMQLLQSNRAINGFVEIGSTGRYASELKRRISINSLYFIHDTPPTFKPDDIVERGSLRPYGKFIAMNNYDEITEDKIPSSSVDLVINYIGLHHCPPEKLNKFIHSIYRIIKPGGIFILRDHNVQTPQMHTFVSLVHTVFNSALGISWEMNQKELRYFNTLDHWISLLEQIGFKQEGAKLLQPHDPSLNTLVRFNKPNL